MADRVKNAVVNLGLQIGWIEGNDNHKFPGWKNVTDAMKEAQALLKEQEAVTEYVMDEFQPTCKACGFRPFAGYIPSLEWMRERGFRFCPKCGQTVKWDG